MTAQKVRDTFFLGLVANMSVRCNGGEKTTGILEPDRVARTESASSPLVGFIELNDNTIKGSTSLLSVEQEIEFIAYTCRL